MSKFKMSVDLNILNHLGINLYSNIASVLSEVVANAYDADATNVDIFISDNQVVISDNGFGMSAEDVNNKYLMVGYQKRLGSGDNRYTPKYHRLVMGRKGIGKLSLMSIANEIEVYTIKDGKQSALKINVNDIKTLIDQGSKLDYEPKEIEFDPNLASGTKIILRDIRKNRTLSNPDKIKTELARRFIVYNDQFIVKVNGKEITFEDRKYFKKVSKIFKYGECGIKINQQLSYFDEDLKVEDRDNSILINDQKTCITGWIGYVNKSDDLKDVNNSLNKISILTNGKMGQEDILQELHNTSMFTNYIIGEINANFLDEQNDYATSNREGYQHESDEYTTLLEFLRKEISHIGAVWNKDKNKEGVEVAIKVIPKIDEWYSSLEGDDKTQAKKLLGKINTMVTNEEQRKDFTKYGILAFEKMKYKKNLSAIDQFDESTISALPKLLKE